MPIIKRIRSKEFHSHLLELGEVKKIVKFMYPDLYFEDEDLKNLVGVPNGSTCRLQFQYLMIHGRNIYI